MALYLDRDPGMRAPTPPEFQPFLPPAAVGFEPAHKPRALSYEAFIPAIQALIVPTSENEREALLDYLRAIHVKLDDRPVTEWTRRNPWYHAFQDARLAAAMIKGGRPETAIKAAQACSAQDLEFNIWGLPGGGGEMRPFLMEVHKAVISERWGVNTEIPGKLWPIFWEATAPLIGRA